MVSGTTEIRTSDIVADTWSNIGRISHKPTADIIVPVVSAGSGEFVGMVTIRSYNGDIDIYAKSSHPTLFACFTYGYETND